MTEKKDTPAELEQMALEQAQIYHEWGFHPEVCSCDIPNAGLPLTGDGKICLVCGGEI